MRGCVTAKDEDAVQTAKKYVGKIHEEEKSKEPHPSPISQKSREKYSEMEKKTQEHDAKKSQKWTVIVVNKRPSRAIKPLY